MNSMCQSWLLGCNWRLDLPSLVISGDFWMSHKGYLEAGGIVDVECGW